MILSVFEKQRFRKIVKFIGWRVLRYLAVGSIVGLLLFFVELGFAFGLQAFLLTLGVMNPETVHLPKWIPLTSFGHVLVFLISAALLRAWLLWMQQFTQGATSEWFNYLQRSRILEWTFFSESASSAETSSLFAIKADNAGKAIMLIQGSLVTGTSTLLLGLTIFAISFKLTLLSIVLLGVLMLPLRVFDRRIKAAGLGSTQEWDRMNRGLLSSIKNLLLMQIHGTQEIEQQKAERSLTIFRDHSLNFYRDVAVKNVLPTVLGISIVCLMSYFAKKTEELSSALLLSYFYLFIRLVQNVSELARNQAGFSYYWPALTQTTEWWADHSPDGVRGKALTKIDPTSLPPVTSPLGWKTSELSFRYPNSEKELLKNLTLEVKPGEAFIIVGASGAGKSTLLNLFLGIIKPVSGSINVFIGQNGWQQLTEVNRQAMLHNIGYVGAESFLFEGTILQNISYGLAQAPSELELQEAIALAECEFIFEHPAGINHFLTEQGQGLSAGQKQRLGLARALLRKPKALILDEATANLDFETEVRLVRTLKTLKGRMTILGVTHRQALLEIADQQLNLGHKHKIARNC